MHWPPALLPFTIILFIIIIIIKHLRRFTKIYNCAELIPLTHTNVRVELTRNRGAKL